MFSSFYHHLTLDRCRIRQPSMTLMRSRWGMVWNEHNTKTNTTQQSLFIYCELGFPWKYNLSSLFWLGNHRCIFHFLKLCEGTYDSILTVGTTALSVGTTALSQMTSKYRTDGYFILLSPNPPFDPCTMYLDLLSEIKGGKERTIICWLFTRFSTLLIPLEQ